MIFYNEVNQNTQMNFNEIDKRVKTIRELVMRARIDEALVELNNFIKATQDTTLEDQIITLTGTYNNVKKEERIALRVC